MTKNKQNTIPKGYKQTKLGVIPKDWELRKISELANVNKETLGSSIKENYEFYYIDLSSVKRGGIDLPKKKIKFKNAPSRARRILSKGDVIMATVRPNLQGFAYVDFQVENYICSTGFALISPLNDVDGKYIYQSLYSHFIESQIYALVVGSNYPAINNSDVENLKIPSPNNIEEREKIAKILSTWDKAINNYQLLIVNYQLKKKGLMQKLLKPKKDWKEVRLGDLGETYSGLSGKSKDDFGKGKPYIPYMNIYTNSIIDSNFLDYVVIKETDKQNQVKYGDIFFTVSSETPDEVGMSSVLLSNFDELYLNSFCFGFRLNSFDDLLPEFSAYLLRSQIFRKEMYKAAQGATRFNLSKGNVMKVKLSLPNLQTQTQIANILSSADKEIDILEQQLEKLKA